mgnify:FL=1
MELSRHPDPESNGARRVASESLATPPRSQQPMLPAMLARRARQSPGETCIIEAETGARVTYRELADESGRLAHGLKSLGVRAGDAVATMLPHCIDTYRVWFGLACLGALETPIGTRYRGRMMQHILDDSRASLVIIDRDYLGAFAQIVAEGRALHVTRVVVRGSGPSVDLPGHIETTSLDDLRGGADDDAEPRDALEIPAPHNLALVLYTSGTTGPSKGVLVPWGQVHATVTGVFPEGALGPGEVP